MRRLTDAGLGLDHGTIRLERTTAAWIAAGTALRDEVATILGDTVTAVAPIGSASVPGLLAKPIIDLAAGINQDQEPATVRLEAAGWLYVGDAGDDGGHVFVLESRPRHRVAHLHLVPHDGLQWRNYLRLRDLLRADPAARDRYEAVKRELFRRTPDDRKGYTEGKTGVVAALLSA
ncbi:GrpB family protein [Catenuloplanes japonicus]|uniref:GrpB family protein n=1 Tax=Catenuloplanes japonicus TaxID=33876 RepID=UPI00068E385A|nr:GrpB family protein [Catenuloplanes japonicus]